MVVTREALFRHQASTDGLAGAVAKVGTQFPRFCDGDKGFASTSEDVEINSDALWQ